MRGNVPTAWRVGRRIARPDRRGRRGYKRGLNQEVRLASVNFGFEAEMSQGWQNNEQFHHQ
jgi:hypothetical protein